MRNFTQNIPVFIVVLCCLCPQDVSARLNMVLTIPPITAALTGRDVVEPPPEAAPTVMWKGQEWQQNDNGRRYDWDGALEYCYDLVLDGHDDWHLPTKDELKGLVVCSNGVPTPLKDFPEEPSICGDNPYDPYSGFISPTIDPSFTCHKDNYWSTGYVNENYFKRTNFQRGGTGSSLRTEKLYVRCVRYGND